VAFPSPDTPVVFFPHEAWVDAPRLASALVELARWSGAEARFGNAVEEIETEGGRVSALRLRGGERLPVDAVVNAAGPEADRVAALLGRSLPLESSKGLISRVAVEGPPICRLVHSRYVNLRPDGPGRVVLNHGWADQTLESDNARTEDSLVSRAAGACPTGGSGARKRGGRRSPGRCSSDA
jgi:glycine/D-amino acid oxidase-like deaminating enzyme